MARSVNDETKTKWRRVLAGLINATEGQKIQWDRTAKEAAFITSLGTHVILLEKEDEEGSIRYSIEIQDISGELIDEFDDRDLDDNPFDESTIIAMANLHLKIRRQISGADAAINDVLAELEKLDDEIPF